MPNSSTYTLLSKFVFGFFFFWTLKFQVDRGHQEWMKVDPLLQKQGEGVVKMDSEGPELWAREQGHE